MPYYQHCRFYLLSGPYLDPLLTTFLLIRNYKTNHRTMRVKSNASFWGLDTIEVHHKLLLKPFELMFDHFEACQKQKLLSMLFNLRLKIVETLIWSFKRIFIHSRWLFLINWHFRISNLFIWDHFHYFWILLWHFLWTYFEPILTTSLHLGSLNMIRHEHKWS